MRTTLIAAISPPNDSMRFHASIAVRNVVNITTPVQTTVTTLKKHVPTFLCGKTVAAGIPL